MIELFAASLDPDYPGHVLLEQYQAQVKSYKMQLLYFSYLFLFIVMCVDWCSVEASF